MLRLTGAAIPVGNEQKMVSYYFSYLSTETQGIIANELIQRNKELQQFYDDLMNTEGLMHRSIPSQKNLASENIRYSNIFVRRKYSFMIKIR